MRALSLQKQIPSATLQPGDSYYKQTGGCFWLHLWKILHCNRYWGDESQGLAYTGQQWTSVLPQHTAFTVVTILSSVGCDSYLVEVGGPVLSILGLSFICELFVCLALHCHSALANLPNESQELHNNKKQITTTTKKKRHLLLLIHQFYTSNASFFPNQQLSSHTETKAIKNHKNHLCTTCYSLKDLLYKRVKEKSERTWW